MKNYETRGFFVVTFLMLVDVRRYIIWIDKMAEGDPKVGQVDSWRGDEITISTRDDPIPTLYHSETSYYSQLVRLVLEEEGIQYKSRAVDIHSHFEQMEPWYININPSAVVPTLIYKGQSVVESKDIALFVVQEISNQCLLLPRTVSVANFIFDLTIFYK